MALGKLPVPGRPTNFDSSRARAYCAYSRCGWGLFGHIYSRLSFLFFFSPSPWETARYRLKYCLKGLLSPKQPTNQPKCRRNAERTHDCTMTITNNAINFCMSIPDIDFKIPISADGRSGPGCSKLTFRLNFKR